MQHIFFSIKLSTRQYLQFFKTFLLVTNGASLFIYGFLHFIFFDFPFETVNELLIVVKLFGVATSIAVALSLLLLVTDYVEKVSRQVKWPIMPGYVKGLSAAALLTTVLLVACNGKVSVGVEKDLNTGLVTNYSNLKPGKTMLVMNNEILNHTDIPFGESFMLINSDLDGLVVKDDKVSVGASLIITDKNGKQLLNEADLFAGKDILHKDSANYLKMTIPTGEPMAWEEKYDAVVTFWDKYGTGKIENKVSFRCIDMP